MILGTVQFGVKYGINNIFGKPSSDLVTKILHYAFENRISILDTAEAYGNSQKLIGNFIKSNPNKPFDIITKLNGTTIIKKNKLIDHINQTCKVLNVESIYGYTIHNYQSIKKFQFLYLDILNAKKTGIIKNAGISVYENNEIEDVIKNYNDFDFIQIPFNLLDNESKRKTIMEKAKQNKIEIHARSIFLQGLFFKPYKEFPQKLKPLIPYIKTLNNIKDDLNIDMQTMAIKYAFKKKYIDKVLIGIDNINQLKNNIDVINLKTDISTNEIDKINVLEKKTLSPTNW